MIGTIKAQFDFTHVKVLHFADSYGGNAVETFFHAEKLV